MDSSKMAKLEKMRKDFQAVTGEPFSWFYCPILFRDEDVDLCKAHIVNRAFEDSPRTWTLQRADVDNFFGRFFEADFVNIQHHGKVSPDQCLVNKELAAKFDPHIRLRGDSVDYYLAKGSVPYDHTRIVLETSTGNVELGLKVRPEEVASAAPEDWAITVEKDLRVPALVSLLKAAHLTLFEMLGYRYCLSASGHFMGSTILGNFFAQNQNKSKTGVMEKASAYFEDFKNMVRPVESHTPTLEGTAVDTRLYICETSAIPWAFMIFIRTSETRHAVLVPIFEHLEGTARFLTFLKSDGGIVEGRFGTFVNGAFWVTPKLVQFAWPKVDMR